MAITCEGSHRAVTAQLPLLAESGPNELFFRCRFCALKEHFSFLSFRVASLEYWLYEEIEISTGKSRLGLAELASIAEVIAAIGVVIGLIFVGYQIRDGNLETRAATVQASQDAEMFLVARFLESPEIWDKVMLGHELEAGLEARKGLLLFNLAMIEAENRFHQLQSGFLDEESWNGRNASLAEVVKLPIFSTWRRGLGARGRSVEFLNFLDELAASHN